MGTRVRLHHGYPMCRKRTKRVSQTYYVIDLTSAPNFPAHHRITPENEKCKIAIFDSGLCNSFIWRDDTRNTEVSHTESLLGHPISRNDVNGHGTHVTSIVFHLARNADIAVYKVYDSSSGNGNVDLDVLEMALGRCVRNFKPDIIVLAMAPDGEIPQGMRDAITEAAEQNENLVICAALGNGTSANHWGITANYFHVVGCYNMDVSSHPVEWQTSWDKNSFRAATLDTKRSINSWVLARRCAGTFNSWSAYVASLQWSEVQNRRTFPSGDVLALQGTSQAVAFYGGVLSRVPRQTRRNANCSQMIREAVDETYRYHAQKEN